MTKFFDPKDPLGWGYSYLESSNLTTTEPIKGLIDVIPDDNPNMPHEVVKSCKPENPPQPYVITPTPTGVWSHRLR